MGRMREQTKVKGTPPTQAEDPPTLDPADLPSDGTASPSDRTDSTPDPPLQVVFAEELTRPEPEGVPTRPDAPAPPGEGK